MDAAFGPTVGKSDNGVFEGHETGEGLSFFDRDVERVPGSTLGGEPVSFVLNSEGFDDFDDAGVWIRGKVPVLYGMLNLRE